MNDVYGRILADALAGKDVAEIVEGKDGFIRSFRADYLLAPYRKWKPQERKAMRYVRGRVLDLGCGGGRVCLYLQERGLEVVGIDASPGAIAVCLKRGVRDARVHSIESVDESLGTFDSVVLLGNNFGLLGTVAKARRSLSRLHALTTDRGRIVAESFDPHGSDDSVGVGRVRVRYRHMTTPWFDYLQVSPDELDELTIGTGWRRTRTFAEGAGYVALLEKDPSS